MISKELEALIERRTRSALSEIRRIGNQIAVDLNFKSELEHARRSLGQKARFARERTRKETK